MNVAKKRFALLLSALLLISAVLSACSGNNNGGSGGSASSSPSSSSAASPSAPSGGRDVGGLSLPIAEEKLNLSLWSPIGGNFRGTNFNEKASFQKMEENTNVHIDFQHAAEGASADAFTLLMSSGSLPDMIYYERWSADAVKYGEQGALLPLEDLIEQHAPNFKKILDENPDIRGQLTTPDGHIYYMPNLILESKDLVQMFPQIRQDWLDKLNLQQPATTEDWYNVLKAFREQDPNGNGKKDEIPLVSVFLDNIVMLFAPAFGVPVGMNSPFFVEDGQVKYGPADPRFKDVVTFLNRLYSEQLLDPEYLVDTTFDTLTEKVTTDVAGAWFGWSGSYMGNFTTLMAGKHDTFKISPVLPPEGPNGDRGHVSFRWQVGDQGLAVSSQTKNPEEVVKWLDYQYSEEGILLNNFGVEGQSYDIVDGQPVFKQEVLYPTNGLTNTQELLNHTIGGGTWSTVADTRYSEQIRVANGQTENPLELYADYLEYDKKLPPVKFTSEENDIVTPLMADIQTYVTETINQMIMGRTSPDTYDQVIAQLEKMGIKEVLAQYQSAYDRFNGN
ncbi:extracellular solute-binding protein [Cohnella algarum]|uniref:extracellular solute-binding protein n=1 Tax=Cohnella algarum TaxID=2044859 RepID=UPI001967F1D9|nr:extracellular solute-binding protein [Cohnella algarum]MBN2980818.1 extracellular solute-binding protein [Cohnella algarum]